MQEQKEHHIQEALEEEHQVLVVYIVEMAMEVVLQQMEDQVD